MLVLLFIDYEVFFITLLHVTLTEVLEGFRIILILELRWYDLLKVMRP